ncbi:ATP-binding cassette domain-containing protein [Prosthecochloris sp. SCSIO W1102]|uniref:ATP-binding cassette domain-containing protein n=1 Tax=Prosthecochloris sp. SCSIO W1102 TaxID=2992243 RepID=UPI00223E0737|nr:ATP-binding cassette domain-containing protein [Prosthecochloris sp. SCSIO W1102]UZJ39803.1 ATP-binding cassette domain-containing protein [Prosthecochloris sp. SCSIO W1102]
MEISLLPGVVKKGNTFSIFYQTDNGGQFRFCQSSNDQVGYTTLRSPSGTGKSTLLQRFIDCLKHNKQREQNDLNFILSHKDQNINSHLSIGKVPQNPSFVKHWHVSKLLPENSWAGNAAFATGAKKWSDIYTNRMGELSGGQQRRIYASSVLEKLSYSNCTTAILVLDETLDGLGTEGAGQFLTNIAKAWMTQNEKALYILLVTHLPEIYTEITEAVKARLTIIEESQSQLKIRLSS